MKLFQLILILSPHFLFCNNIEHSIGNNFNISLYKFSGGLEYNIIKINSKKEFTPLFTVNINYGIMGNKEFSIDKVHINENNQSFSITNEIEPPSGFLYTDNNYYNSYEKLKLIGYEITFTRPFKIYKNLFSGVGLGFNKVTNNGYVLWLNPFTNSSIKDSYNFNFHSAIIFSSISYIYNISSKLFFKPSISFAYYIPLKDNLSQSYYPSNMPNVGVESNISISLNLKI